MHWNVEANAELLRLVSNYELSVKSAAEAFTAQHGQRRVKSYCVKKAVEMLAFTDLQRRVKSLEAEIEKLKTTPPPERREP